MRSNQRIFVATALNTFMFFSILSAGIMSTTRTMTDQEFNTLKSYFGVCEPGRNYNIIINGHGTGLRPPTEGQWETMRTMPIKVNRMNFQITTIPEKHINSDTSFFPPIGNQDGEGSCVGWATGYYTKTFQDALEHGWDLSDCQWEGGYSGHPTPAYQNEIFSPDFIYHQINDGVDEGSWFWDAMNLLQRIGCCTWDKMPYDPNNSTDWPSEAAWRQAPLYRSLTPYTYADVTTHEQQDTLKLFLANYNLAVIGVDAYYYDGLTSDDLWTVDNYTYPYVNHANTVVGYDDSFGPYIENGETHYGAFKVANSWGVGYGNWENVDDGFFWISYECMKQKIRYYMFYENIENYNPTTISVFHLVHGYRGECQVTVGMGNISSPEATKRFDDYSLNGGNNPYPSNNMVLDISEFNVPTGKNLFLRVYDGGSTTIGSINSFSVEKYDDYLSGEPISTYVSADPPVNTINGNSVYAQVVAGINVTI